MRLKLKTPPPFRVDMSVLTPQYCTDQGADALAQLLLQTAGQKVQLKELFEIDDDGKERLEISGACDKLDYLGKHMESGELIVSGDIGNYAGAMLTGGVLEVRGDVGDFCGHAMRGGSIVIRGNAGDYCGGAIAGHTHSMNGGEILVNGHVGDYCGDRMRRGLIAVHGRIGDYCGRRMKAGTIIASGQCGKACGNGMARGSIILFKLPEGGITSTFITQDIPFSSDFLGLLSDYLQKADFGFEPLPLARYAQRYVGDRALQGKGEILILGS